MFANLKPDFTRISVLRRTNSEWKPTDYLGAFKVRWSIGRNNYKVEPGLYQLGMPTAESPVLVTANYKLTFDLLRRDLKGINCWILVLDTKGINVWCAAGKGTMGTKELLNRIEATGLAKYVSHRKIILPQLAAPGVAAHEIKKKSGFSVVYGPVRSSDIPAFLEQKQKCDEEMRTVHFSTYDRLILTPVEIANSLKYLLIAIVVFAAISGLSQSGYQFGNIVSAGIKSALILFVAYFTGAFLTPVLLPWVPSKMFSMKGLLLGIIGFLVMFAFKMVDLNVFAVLGWLFLSVSVSSFLAMNFTGASTFTSLSGVKKEMAIFVPVQLISVVVGLALVVISKFFSIWPL